MNMVKIRTIASSLGINHGRITKTDLIKRIQLREGNFDCYSSALSGKCDRLNCLWRSDCFDAAPPRDSLS